MSGSIFLSTPSARRATEDFQLHYICTMISIHALREEGDIRTKSTLPVSCISIHALREEGDVSFVRFAARFMVFLSTPSARRATAPMCHSRLCAPISIHALREEGDAGAFDYSQERSISIHALREEGDTCRRFSIP